NILFFLVFFSVPLLVENVLIYSLALIPTGPALAALFFSMGVLVRQKSLVPLKDFFRGYKDNLKVSLVFWVIQLTLSVIVLVDAFYFYTKGSVLVAIIFALVFVLLAIFSMIGFPMLAIFEITVANIYRSAVVIMWRYFRKQLGNLLTIIAFAVIFYAFPSEMFLFFFSLIAFYIMRSNQTMFIDLESQFSQINGSYERGTHDD
ncbi:MAG TPA: DUF624 domain-containing protein, partial [Candidatus Jeotgalibaca pullicola]|nr:DUF624 domain-containing protein [Candidatus Jeotgalibaca pullicola]